LRDAINRHGEDADNPTAEGTKQSYEGNTPMWYTKVEDMLEALQFMSVR